MTSINVSNLVLNLQQKINSTTDEADLLYYSKALQQLRTGHIFKVNAVSELPTPQQNPGLIYYVISDKTTYFSAGENGWIEIYKSSISPIFSWGLNCDGRLGDGTLINKCVPVREISSSTDWCQLGVGTCHTAAIKTSGELWLWGSNSCGQLSILGGFYGISVVCSPIREICSATDWCQVSVGTCYTAAVKTTGQLWSWGRNNCGQLGVGTTVATICSPVREFCSATDWCQVSAGPTYQGLTAAIKTSGELWLWGSNGSGQLGDGTITSRCSPVRERCSATNWCQVSTGDNNTFAIKTSGELWVWGYNSCGRLGDGTITSRCSPVRERCSATDWCQVSISSAVKTSGQLWSWGRNFGGNIGDGTTINRCSPVREISSSTDWCFVSTATAHAAAVKTSGQIWAWGSNACGTLGDGTLTDRCSPVREISSSTDWCRVGAACRHTAAIKQVSF